MNIRDIDLNAVEEIKAQIRAALPVGCDPLVSALALESIASTLRIEAVQIASIYEVSAIDEAAKNQIC